MKQKRNKKKKKKQKQTQKHRVMPEKVSVLSTFVACVYRHANTKNIKIIALN